jgi:NAD(P)-dependent dehydrogenase (short-subunit alcohol dehydrogenase family)
MGSGVTVAYHGVDIPDQVADLVYSSASGKIDILVNTAGIQHVAPKRTWLASEFEAIDLRRGDILMRGREASDALYIVICGRFTVTVNGQASPIAEIGPTSRSAKLASWREAYEPQP